MFKNFHSFLVFLFHLYIYKCLKLYQLYIIKKIKKYYNKKRIKDTKSFLIKKKKKSNNIIENVKNIYQEEKQSLLSIKKNLAEWKKFLTKTIYKSG